MKVCGDISGSKNLETIADAGLRGPARTIQLAIAVALIVVAAGVALWLVV
jgi:hypothetical protein